jgi:hypothetical protein
MYLPGKNHGKRVDPEHQLQEPDELFAARMQKSVTSCPAKALWQDMKHEKIQEPCSADSPGSVLSAFGMKIPEGNHIVFALKNIFFPDNTPVQVAAQIDDGLVAVADAFAVDNPLFRTTPGHVQGLINHGFQHLCPKDLCQGFVAEEIPGPLFLP